MSRPRSTVSFHDILDWVGAGDHPLRLAVKIDYIRYTAVEPLFEAPSLRVGEERAAGSPILLVSAGAAVGKSILARQIAAHLGSVYCDLSQINVGAQTFQGILLTAFGPHGISEAVAGWSRVS